MPVLYFLLAGGVALEGFLGPEVAGYLSRPTTIQGGVAKFVTRGDPIYRVKEGSERVHGTVEASIFSNWQKFKLTVDYNEFHGQCRIDPRENGPL